MKGENHLDQPDPGAGRPMRGSIWHLLATALVLVMAVTTIFAGATGAVFTDTQSVGLNSFSTGTVDISTAPTSALVSFSSMAPGDKVTNPITVTNGGSLQLRYAVKSTTTENTLAAQLDMIIKTGVTTCTNGGFDASGSAIYGPGDLGNTTGLNVVGDPAQGAQAGDRTLAASANEVLCFQAALPLATGNTYQGLSTTATVEFISEQTTNNP